jgi:hypothetical protein
MTCPIPARLAGRPIVGGLAVPYISIDFGDGTYALGETHNRKAVECILGFRCQACGQPLRHPVVVLATDEQVERKWTEEPGLHPECAAYSVKACPMLAGRMDSYRKAPARAPGKPCDKPGCDCGGWVPTSEHERVGGRPARPWFAVWLPTYQFATDDHGQVRGVAWPDVTPLKIRPICHHGSAV